MANEQPHPLNPKEELLRDLGSREYRRGFVEAHAKDTVAFQLRALRNAEGWEQRDVARQLGNEKLQPMISRYENPDYGRYSIATLLQLANAFDVALVVRFVPFSELVEWDWQSNAQTLCPATYSKDERLLEIAASLRLGGSNEINPAAPKMRFRHRRTLRTWQTLRSATRWPATSGLVGAYGSQPVHFGAPMQQLFFQFENTPVRKRVIANPSNRARAAGGATHPLPPPLKPAAGAGGYYGR